MKAVEIDGIEPEVVKKLEAIELGKSARAYVILYDPHRISGGAVTSVCMEIESATGVPCISVMDGSVKILRLP